MRMVSGRKVRICPSRVAAVRSGNAGATMTTSIGYCAALAMAELPSGTCWTWNSSPRSLR
ncbi:hypothetical protein D3C72_2399060 [compost metagenome]